MYVTKVSHNITNWILQQNIFFFKMQRTWQFKLELGEKLMFSVQQRCINLIKSDSVKEFIMLKKDFHFK